MSYPGLYRIQDKVFATLQGHLGPLYLTGGTALSGRDEPKDVFDIVSIAREYSFSWPEVFEKAYNKAIISEPDIVMRLRTFPPEMVMAQRWLSSEFNLKEFKANLNNVCNDFLLARENSLGKFKKHITKAKPLISGM